MKKSAAEPGRGERRRRRRRRRRRERSKPRWKFMECRSPLFLCSSVSPSPLPRTNDTILSNKGEFQPGSRIDEALVRSVRRFCSHNSFGSLLFPTGETRHCANSPGSESWLRLPFPPLPFPSWLPDNTSPWMSSSS